PDHRHEGIARALNVLGYRWGAFFPMLAGDEAWGVLAFLYQAPREFRGEWTDIGRTVAELTEIGRTVAELMTLALRMQQRYQTSQQEASEQAQRAAQLSILREISRVILGNLELADTLQAIGEQLQAGLGYAGFYVWLYGREGAPLCEAYGRGPNQGWQPGDTERTPPRELQVERSTAAQVVLAPIILEGTTVGIIKLVREFRQGPIAEGEIEVVRMLLDYIGIAVKNSQLYGAIKETKSYLENLIHGAGDAILTVDREDRVTAWNASAERIFGYAEREMLRQPIWTLFPREPYAQWREEVLRMGSVKHLETRLNRRDGMPIDVRLTLSPLRGPRDELVGVSAILQDVTAETHLRERVLQSEKLRALGEMAAGIAHNFNNVLATISGRAQLLAGDPAHGEAMQRSIASIEQAAEDGAAMVRRLQQFAKGSPEAGFQPTDLNQVVQEAVEATHFFWNEQAQREGRRVEVVLDLETLPPVDGRAAELREVLTNVILNAVEAMPGGGRVTLRTRPRGGMACLEVSDTGSGMTDEVKRRIFDPFFTTKGVKGTGLGLSVSYALIKGHNGEIEVQSELGRGTTFSITLPVGP
ncbi:MAG: PAS domain S-box protein, partial [Nitrospinae bacterium]|nr:PAS domain S-box protein [Nitrospinota bacterium]